MFLRTLFHWSLLFQSLIRVLRFINISVVLTYIQGPFFLFCFLLTRSWHHSSRYQIAIHRVWTGCFCASTLLEFPMLGLRFFFNWSSLSIPLWPATLSCFRVQFTTHKAASASLPKISSCFLAGCFLAHVFWRGPVSRALCLTRWSLAAVSFSFLSQSQLWF